MNGKELFEKFIWSYKNKKKYDKYGQSFFDDKQIIEDLINISKLVKWTYKGGKLKTEFPMERERNNANKNS